MKGWTGTAWRRKNFCDTFQLNDILGNIHKHFMRPEQPHIIRPLRHDPLITRPLPMRLTMSPQLHYAAQQLSGTKKELSTPLSVTVFFLFGFLDAASQLASPRKEAKGTQSTLEPNVAACLGPSLMLCLSFHQPCGAAPFFHKFHLKSICVPLLPLTLYCC